MNKADFLEQLDHLLELPAGTLTGGESLADFESWDSMAAIDYLALVDERFGLTISPQRLADCRTVNDLVREVGDAVTD